MNEEIEKITRNMLFIIIKYGDDFDELEENEIRYQLPYKQMEKLYDYITNLQEESQNLINGIDEINKCMKKYEKTSVDDAKTIITFYKQLKNILDKLTELKKEVSNNE